MEKNLYSIFNDVFGPVMIGPSSSHTAGPARIGKVIHMLLNDRVTRIRIIFDANGSYINCYTTQGTNYGFVGGIQGIDITDERIKNALAIAEENGVAVSFESEDFGSVHPNFARIIVEGSSGEQVMTESISTGGGMFDITNYNGFPLVIKGDCYNVLVTTTDKELAKAVEERMAALKDNTYLIETIPAPEGEEYLINVRLEEDVDAALIEELSGLAGVVRVRLVKPVLPVVKRFHLDVPFSNAREAEDYAQRSGRSLWEIGLDYECALSGQTPQQLMERMEEIVCIMREEGENSLAGKMDRRGFMTPKGKLMKENMERGEIKTIGIGLCDRVVLVATAVEEYNVCRGKIVAAPTGGSCGIVPGAVVALGDDLGIDNREIAKAMFAAGIVGVFFANSATFGAEVAGCQAEVGASSSIAAGGVAHYLGATVAQGFAAASAAIQNLMGLICDPITGIGNIPCVTRNALGAVNAVVSANMVVLGFDPFVPLDEAVESMLHVGELMPREHRCTQLGGICATNCAKRAFALLEKGEQQ